MGFVRRLLSNDCCQIGLITGGCHIFLCKFEALPERQRDIPLTSSHMTVKRFGNFELEFAVCVYCMNSFIEVHSGDKAQIVEQTT